MIIVSKMSSRKRCPLDRMDVYSVLKNRPLKVVVAAGARSSIRGSRHPKTFDFGVPIPIYLRKSINPQRLFSARKRNESVSVRHFHFSQRLRVHRVVVCDDTVEVQDISDYRVGLVVGQ